MGKILFTQNSFENTCMDMECRDVGVEVKKWSKGDVYKKMHIVSLYYDDQPIICATTFTPIWERGLVI